MTMVGTLVTVLTTLFPAQGQGTVPAEDAATGRASTPAEPEPGVRPEDALRGPIAEWLVDLARHQGHMVGRQSPRSASLHVIALLKGAVAVDSNCAEAHYWLYDLEQRMGREEPARRALSEYVRLAPGDEAARIRFFEMSLEGLQTAESRAEFVKEQLKLAPLPLSFESKLHGWLGRYYFERGENDLAGREIEQALRLDPMNVAARELGYQLFGETEPALQRVETALQLIAMNPSQANLVWDLAGFLDRLSLHAAAQEWYNRAIDIHRRAEAGPIPVEFWHKLAVSYLSSGDFARAKEAADEALLVEPQSHTSRLLLSQALRKMGKKSEADAEIDRVGKDYEARIETVVAEKRYDEAAEIAWFYGYHRPDAGKALRLSELAMEDAQPSFLARAAHGIALRLHGRLPEAVKALSPLAGVDQFVALELARAEFDLGKKTEAMQTLRGAAAIQHSGIGYELISELLLEQGEKPPPGPSHEKIQAALANFKRDVFDYYQRPGDFLQLTVDFADESPAPTAPIRVAFRLENVGPFPITFGEGFMARPLIALSAKVGRAPEAGRADEPAKEYENYLQILMNSRPMLRPGESMEKLVSVDVGPIRNHLLRTVSEPTPIELTAMFDPVYKGQTLAAGLGTISAGPIKAIRAALDVTPEGIRTIVARAHSAETPQRMLAADQIGAILAAIDGGMATDAGVTGAADTLQATLVELVSDEAWPVRARALVAAGWSPLHDRVAVAASQFLRKEPPVTRLLAIRLFAEQHGEKFRRVLERYCKSDAAPYVRMMAASFLPPMTQAQAGEEAGGGAVTE